MNEPGSRFTFNDNGIPDFGYHTVSTFSDSVKLSQTYHGSTITFNSL